MPTTAWPLFCLTPPNFPEYSVRYYIFFFFNDTAPTEIYTLSLHDALPISKPSSSKGCSAAAIDVQYSSRFFAGDRKSTRLNSSHTVISYAGFCLQKNTYQEGRELGLGAMALGAGSGLDWGVC